MARIRTIKPEINSDGKAARLDDDAWRLWVSSWTLADDAGRLPADPAWLGGQIFWAKPDPTECASRALAKLRESSMVGFYVVRGEPYMSIRGWTKHQKIDKPSGPKFPGPDQVDGELSTATLAKPREDSRSLDPDHDHDRDLDLDDENKNMGNSRDREHPQPDLFNRLDQDDGRQADATGLEASNELGSDPHDVAFIAPAGSQVAGNANQKPNPKARTMPPDEALTLARLLMGYVVQNAPDNRVAKKTEREREHMIERWADPIEKLHRLDRQSWGTIEGAIHWVAKDSFWRSVILGGDNLRAKWDTIAGQRNRGRKTQMGKSSPTAAALADVLKFEALERAQKESA